MKGLTHQKGLTLLEVALILALLGLLGSLIFVLLQRADQYQSLQRASDLLRTADRAVSGFMAEHNRLPCPDLDGDGLEDCTGGEKGWLPVQTLGLHLSAPVPALPPIRYLASPSLLQTGDRFEPSRWDYWAKIPYDTSAVIELDHSNGFDFCQQIEDVTRSGGEARVELPDGSTSYPIAWGLALPGEDGEFSARNGSASGVLESPARPAAPEYDDLVIARSLAEVADVYKCDQATASMHNMGMSVEMINEVEGQLAATRDSAIIASTTAGVKSAIALVNVIKAGIAMKGSVSALTEAISLLAKAIAGCAMLVGCAMIPVYAAAVAAASTAVVSAGVAIALHATALALTLGATVETAIVAARAGHQVGTLDIDEVEALAALKEGKEEACSDHAEAVDELDEAREDLIDAREAMNRFETNLRIFADDHHRPGHNYYHYIEDAQERFAEWTDEVWQLRHEEGELKELKEELKRQEEAVEELEKLVQNPNREYPGIPGSNYSNVDPEVLENALTRSKERLEELRQEIKEAENRVKAQVERENQAEMAYKLAVIAARDAYNYEYHYTDSDGNPQVEYIRGGNGITAMFFCTTNTGQYLKEAQCRFDHPFRKPYPVVYGELFTAEGKIAELEKSIAEKRESCEQATESLEKMEEQLKDPDFQGQAETYWTDPDEILQRADERGALR